MSLGVDGMFGPMTKQAVIDFQAKCGLPPIGVVDQATWTEIDRAMTRKNRMAAPDADAPKLVVSQPSERFVKDVFEVIDITVTNAGSTPARDVRVSVAAPAQFDHEGDVCEFGDIPPGARGTKSVNLAFSAAGRVRTRFSIQYMDAHGRLKHAGYTDHLLHVDTPASAPSIVYDQRMTVDKSQTIIQDSVINRSSIGKSGSEEVRDSVTHRSSLGGGVPGQNASSQGQVPRQISSIGGAPPAARPAAAIPPRNRVENSGTDRYRKALETAIFNDGQIDDHERIFLESLQEAWNVDGATSERLEQEVFAEYRMSQSGGGANCPKCGASIKEAWKACPECGVKLR